MKTRVKDILKTYNPLYCIITKGCENQAHTVSNYNLFPNEWLNEDKFKYEYYGSGKMLIKIEP